MRARTALREERVPSRPRALVAGAVRGGLEVAARNPLASARWFDALLAPDAVKIWRDQPAADAVVVG